MAELGGEVVGGVFMVCNPWASFIFHLCVDPEHQRKGIGTKLMDTMEDVLRERDIKNPIIYVRSDNHEALTFYRKRGWKGNFCVIPMIKNMVSSSH